MLLLVMALVLAALLAPSFMMPGVRAAAADGDGAQKVAAFEDVTVVAGEVRDNLVVVGGDVVIHGTVQNVVVVVGGDLVVASDGTVGTARSDDDTVIVSVFGSVDIEQGAKVAGRVVDVAGGGSAPLDAMVVDPVTRPWNDWNSIAGWIGSTVFILLVAVIVAAVAPRQLAFVSERARRHVFSSLGWGALGLIVLLPLVTIVLVFTLVGILALLPFWLAVAVVSAVRLRGRRRAHRQVGARAWRGARQGHAGGACSESACSASSGGYRSSARWWCSSRF